MTNSNRVNNYSRRVLTGKQRRRCQHKFNRGLKQISIHRAGFNTYDGCFTISKSGLVTMKTIELI